MADEKDRWFWGFVIGSVVAVPLAILILVVPLVVDYFDPNGIDACMDGGGCWDSTDKICRNEEANAQELCDRDKWGPFR